MTKKSKRYIKARVLASTWLIDVELDRALVSDL